MSTFPRHRRAVGAALVCAAVMIGFTSCTKGGGDTVAVSGTNDECIPETNRIPAGKVTFEFTNKADDVNELYVLTSDGGVVGEVENVTTGTSRQLNADLKAGTYELACKPGMVGDGIRTVITVTGKGGSAAPIPDRSISFDAVDFAYPTFEPGDIRSGQTIEFDMKNEGTEEHEFEVKTPSGAVLGEIGPTKVGASGKVALTFPEAGTYTYVCGIDGHEAKGMKGSFKVGG